MKRLIKLLSIFGVLIILGSCSSSKSVNTSEITGTAQYVIFKDYSLNIYDVVGIYITGGEYDNYYVNTGDEVEIKSDVNYDIEWHWIDTSNSTAIEKFSTKSKTFNSGYGTLTINLGTGNYSSIFY